MSDEDPTLCPHCGTHFSSAETLAKHMAIIHKCGPASSSPAATSSSKKQKRSREEDDSLTAGASSAAAAASENVELEPLLGVLSEAQKDALIIRALQQDPDFYERIIEQATMVLTEESAEARAATLDGEATAAAIRFYVANGVPANALTLLSAASQRCLAALEDLSGSVGGGGGGDDGEEEVSEQKKEELLAVVEAAPAAGHIGALWVELLAAPAALRLVRTASAPDELRLLLESLQAAAASVRASAPATLVGPGGETIAKLGEAVEVLSRALQAP